jgi:hypothetical protein
VKKALMDYLEEHSSPEIAETAQRIFTNPEKSDKFLNDQFRRELNEILKKIPKHNESALIEMSRLINDKSTKESDMKEFFTQYPWIIGFEYDKFEPQKKMSEKNIPDYLLRRVNGTYDVVEIKGPNDHIFNKNSKKKRMNQIFIDGLIQIIRYIDYCDKHYDYIVTEKKQNIYKPEGILLIDTNLSEEERNDLRMFTSFLHGIRIKTYDEVYDAAENALMLSYK